MRRGYTALPGLAVLGFAAVGILAAGTPAAFAGNGSLVASNGASIATGAPNILLILTDDQRIQDTMAVMPQTQSFFGDGGVTFPNGFITTPLCCPSRASIMSGRYTHNHGVLGNAYPDLVQAFDQSATTQSYLQAGGYNTALVGKYFNTWPVTEAPSHWTKFITWPGTYGSAYYDVQGRVEFLKGYSTDVLSNYAVQDLQDFEATDDKPWFMEIATHAPHSNYTPATKYATAPVLPWVQQPNVNEADVSDKPFSVSSKPLADLTRMSFVRDSQLRTLMSVDDLVANVTATMHQLGETKDTLAVFMSDNGFFWGEHRIPETKRWPYTESVTVPFFMRWPGHLDPGTVKTRMISNVDLLPTFLEASGVSPTLKYPLDGRSILSSSRRHRILLEYFKSGDSPLGPWASIRTKTWQYIEWYDKTSGAMNFREYYDLVHDPYQLRNILKDGIASNDPDVAALSSDLATYRTCAGSSCP